MLSFLYFSRKNIEISLLLLLIVVISQIMNPVSPEQYIIIENIKKGENVVVDACAGSGKSTTIL